MGKVYCRQCKYYKYPFHTGDEWYATCNASETEYRDNAFRREKKSGEFCNEKNANNDCADYKGGATLVGVLASIFAD